MTRKDADELQMRLDEHSKLSDMRDDDSSTETERLPKMRKLAMSTVKHILAGTIEPYIPTVHAPGVDFDLSALIGTILNVASPKTLDAPKRIAVVDGYEEEDGEGRWDEYMEKYGVTVPGDVMKEALLMRMSRVTYKLMSSYVPSEKKEEGT